MALLHTSTSTLDGTAYIEFLPGSFGGTFWSEVSVFLGEEAFAYVEPHLARALPDFDYYAVTQVQKPRWLPILADLDGLSKTIASHTGVDALAADLACFNHVRGSPLLEPSASVADVQQMLGSLTEWLQVTLEQHDCVSILGL